MHIRPIKGKESLDVYHLMVQENFPETPDSFIKAKPFLDECICFGIFDDGGCLYAAFILGDINETSAFLDVVCQSEKRGKWLNKKVIQFMMKLLFECMSLNYIWVQPQNSISHKLAVNFGFQLVHDYDERQGVCLILSKDMYLKSKFNRQRKR